MEKKIDLGEESKRNIHIRSLDYMTTKKLLNKLEVVSFIYIYIYGLFIYHDSSNFDLRLNFSCGPKSVNLLYFFFYVKLIW